MAQHEIGGIFGGMNGVSYKYWFTESFALQGDLAVGLTRAAGDFPSFGLYDFTINPNALYHWQLPENFNIYAGGGASLGLMGAINGYGTVDGKFGLNAAVGATYDLQEVPLVFALDFRPGYGLGFNANPGQLNYFDWKLAFAVRYRL